MAKTEMTCKELVEIITAYLEGTLPTNERDRFDRHLVICPHCQNYLDQMRQTIDLTGTLTEDKLDPEAKDDLMEIFRDWKNGRDKPASS